MLNTAVPYCLPEPCLLTPLYTGSEKFSRSYSSPRSGVSQPPPPLPLRTRAGVFRLVGSTLWPLVDSYRVVHIHVVVIISSLIRRFPHSAYNSNPICSCRESKPGPDCYRVLPSEATTPIRHPSDTHPTPIRDPSDTHLRVDCQIPSTTIDRIINSSFPMWWWAKIHVCRRYSYARDALMAFYTAGLLYYVLIVVWFSKQKKKEKNRMTTWRHMGGGGAL